MPQAGDAHLETRGANVGFLADTAGEVGEVRGVREVWKVEEVRQVAQVGEELRITNCACVEIE